jgi:hypothetical protein
VSFFCRGFFQLKYSNIPKLRLKTSISEFFLEG